MAYFTIITVCLNEERGIRRTCESIIRQSFVDFEWIVVDGGSTDNTLSILEDFRSRITSLTSEKDEGIYDAMNKGLKIASGNYIVFMNGGDSFSSHNVLQKVAAASTSDIIYGDIYFDEGGGRRMDFPDKINPEYFLNKMIPPQATFYRRELFKKFGVFDTSYRIAADYDLHIRFIEVGKVSCFHINEPLAINDTTGISGNPKFRDLRKKENHSVRKKYFRRYRYSLKFLRQELRERFSFIRFM